MRFILLLLLAAIGLSAEIPSAIELDRIQSMAENGHIMTVTVFDHNLEKDPVSGSTVVGSSLMSTVIDRSTHPALFAELDKLAVESASRLQAAKDKAASDAADAANTTKNIP